MVRLWYFSKKWKSTDVIVLPQHEKSGTFPQNYRPISLLPSMGKIAERIIAGRIQQQTEKLNILPEEQFDFIYEHSIELQILRLVEYDTDGLIRNLITGDILLRRQSIR